MKSSFILIIFALITLSACNSKKNSKEIAHYEYKAQTELNDTLQSKVGSWIKEGDLCYGMVISSFSNHRIALAKPVKAKVITITSSAIKMKALETVNVGISQKAQACGKLQIEKGQTWWEEDGDLFRTKEEATAFAKTLNDKARTHKFTID